MTGEKMARIRKCGECPHWFNRHANTFRWPKCDLGVDGGLELDDECLGGPATNCPLILWKNLVPVDLDAEKAVWRQKTIAAQIVSWKDILDTLEPATMLLADARSKLTELVAKEKMLPEVAVEIEAYVTAARVAKRPD